MADTASTFPGFLVRGQKTPVARFFDDLRDAFPAGRDLSRAYGALLAERGLAALEDDLYRRAYMAIIADRDSSYMPPAAYVLRVLSGYVASKRHGDGLRPTVVFVNGQPQPVRLMMPADHHGELHTDPAGLASARAKYRSVT